MKKQHQIQTYLQSPHRLTECVCFHFTSNKKLCSGASHLFCWRDQSLLRCMALYYRVSCITQTLSSSCNFPCGRDESHGPLAIFTVWRWVSYDLLQKRKDSLGENLSQIYAYLKGSICDRPFQTFFFFLHIQRELHYNNLPIQQLSLFLERETII